MTRDEVVPENPGSARRGSFDSLAGSLTDADPARELAQLKALQDSQSPGGAAHLLASRPPRMLVTLFGGG